MWSNLKKFFLFLTSSLLIKYWIIMNNFLKLIKPLLKYIFYSNNEFNFENINQVIC